jgi:hypothetical protein
MKYFLALSLLLNLILTVHWFRTRLPPSSPDSYPSTANLELETKGEKLGKKSIARSETPSSVAQAVTTNSEPHDAKPSEDMLVPEEEVEEMEGIRRGFLEEVEVSEEVLSQKNKILNRLFKASQKIIAAKEMTEITLEDRKQLLALEEQAFRDIEKVFGKKQWQRYKQRVDAYNRKKMQAFKRGESAGLLMSY